MISNVSKAFLASAVLMSALVVSSGELRAQEAIKNGGVLSGELRLMRNRGPEGKRINTFQIMSAPRKLPGPNGLCNLETGPETFQLVTGSDAEANQLKGLVGKQISVTANELSCAELAGEISEAIVSKWSLVKGR
jgi:hypothetical protein